jgi:hypothetical protein
MLRAFAAILGLVLVVTGCTANEQPTSTTQHSTTGAASPTTALRTLLTDVQNGDLDGVAGVTFDDQVALLIALDGASAAEARHFLEDGVPQQSRSMFWASFRDTYSRSFGEDVSEMLVAERDRVTVDLVSFAVVDVALRKTTGQTRWITRMDEDGRWRVDLFATFASTFALPLRLWLTTLADDADTAVVRRAIVDQRPSLLAALQQEPLGPISPGIADQIRGLLTDVGATG